MNRAANGPGQAQARTSALWALQLAFIAAAPGVLAGILGNVANISLTRQIQMVLYLPAVLLGIRAWWQGNSFARSAPVVACVLVTWIGYAYAVPRTREGVEFIIQVTILLPVAALVVDCGAWMLCARTFVRANALVLAAMFLVEFQRHGTALFLGLHRFGLVYTEEEGRMIANPNILGGQFAFAAVLATLVYLRSGTAREGKTSGLRAKGIGLGWSLLYSLACLLTGSRSAFAVLFGGIGTALAGGVKTQRRSRMKDLVAVSVLGVSVVLMLAVFEVFTPWQALKSRWENADNTFALGGRTAIWKDAYRAWRSAPMRMLFGTGTGAAGPILGQFNDDFYVGEDGVPVRGSHSAYIEWGLSFGLFGAIPGICLLAAMGRRARRLDRMDGSTLRQSMLLCVCLWGMATPIYLHPCFLAPGSLILAMLSDPPGADRKRRATPSQARGT